MAFNSSWKISCSVPCDRARDFYQFTQLNSAASNWGFSYSGNVLEGSNVVPGYSSIKLSYLATLQPMETQGWRTEPRRSWGFRRQNLAKIRFLYLFQEIIRDHDDKQKTSHSRFYHYSARRCYIYCCITQSSYTSRSPSMVDFLPKPRKSKDDNWTEGKQNVVLVNRLNADDRLFLL